MSGAWATGPPATGAGDGLESVGAALRRAVSDGRSGAALYVRLAAARTRGQMQYKVSFVLESLATFIGTGLDFVTILVFFTRFDHIGGWTMPEVALLYGLVGVSFALAQFLGAGFEDFEEVIRRGTFDQVLVKPRGAFLQVTGSQFPLRRAGRLLQAGTVLALALWWLEVEWGPGKWAFLGWTVLGGALFFMGLLLLKAAVCFFTVQSVEATNVLTYGGQEMAGYPMHIYGPWLRRAFVFVVPLAFVNYFPAVYLLGKPSPMGDAATYAALAFPLCGVVLLFGIAAWRVGVRHYQSTGS
ncbi:MAG: ABC transporter permease [Anaerolineae bacterium]|jgi:ABC-2 type transport system permease protein